MVTQEPTDATGGTYGSIPTPDATTNIIPDIGPIPSEYSPTKFIDSSGTPVNQDGSPYVVPVKTAPVVQPAPSPVAEPTPEPVVPVETSPVIETAPVAPVVAEPVATSEPIASVAPVETAPVTAVEDKPNVAINTYGTTPTVDTTTTIAPDIGPIPSDFSPTKFVNSSGTPVNEDGSIYVASPVVTAPAPAPELTPTPAPAPAPELTPVPVTPVETVPVVTQGPADTTDTAGGTYGSIPAPDTTTVISPTDTAVDSSSATFPSPITPVQTTTFGTVPDITLPVTAQPVIDTPVTEPFVGDTTASTAPTTGDTTDTMGGTYGFIPPDTTTVISPPDIGPIPSDFSPSGFVNSSGTPVNNDGSIYVAAAPVTDTPVASVDTVAPLAPIEPEGGTYTAEPTPSSGGGGAYTVTPSEDTTTKTADVVDTGPSIGAYTGDTTPESTKIDPTTPLIKTPKEEDSTSTTTITPGSPGVGFKIPTIPGSVKSSPGSSALLAALGASLAPDKELGDVESTTGGKKKLVWNEASLRNLQDALGI